MNRAGVVSLLAVLTLVVAACSSSSDGAPSAQGSAPASTAASAAGSPASSDVGSATPAPSATWAPKDGLHVKVVYQLEQAQAPAACDQASSTAKVTVGTAVTLADASGTTIATAPLRAVKPGETFGPGGYTFSGWDDAPLENGKVVTHACFYVVDFPTTPSSMQYDVTVNGVTSSFDSDAVQTNGGWLPVLL